MEAASARTRNISIQRTARFYSEAAKARFMRRGERWMRANPGNLKPPGHIRDGVEALDTGKNVLTLIVHDSRNRPMTKKELDRAAKKIKQADV